VDTKITRNTSFYYNPYPYSIIGLYTTFVLLASRFMKSFIGGQNRKIMFEDLPYVDRVLQLCLDIYLVIE